MSEPQETDDVTAVLERQLVLDLVPCERGQAAINAMGLNPASDGGAEIEHIMSHARLDKVAPLTGPLAVYSALVAQIWVKLFIAGQPPGMIPLQFHDQIYQAQLMHINQATSAILANMLDAGLLTYGEAFRTQ